jgi:hypothetical protein
MLEQKASHSSAERSELYDSIGLHAAAGYRSRLDTLKMDGDLMDTQFMADASFSITMF